MPVSFWVRYMLGIPRREGVVNHCILLDKGDMCRVTGMKTREVEDKYDNREIYVVEILKGSQKGFVAKMPSDNKSIFTWEEGEWI